MRLQGVKVGDLVFCDIKGRRFHAEVTAPPTGTELEIKPLAPAITYRRVSSRQVKEHWRKAGRRTNGLRGGDLDQDEHEHTDDRLFAME